MAGNFFDLVASRFTDPPKLNLPALLGQIEDARPTFGGLEGSTGPSLDLAQALGYGGHGDGGPTGAKLGLGDVLGVIGGGPKLALPDVSGSGAKISTTPAWGNPGDTGQKIQRTAAKPGETPKPWERPNPLRAGAVPAAPGAAGAPARTSSVGMVPAAGGPIDKSSRQAFLQTSMPYFQQIEAQTGIPAEAMAAIAINEGATTPGTLAYDSGAPFGIKSAGQDANGNDLATGYPVTRVNAGEVENGQNVSRPSAFINFPTPTAAIQGFVDFLQRNPRYAPALEAARRGTTTQEFTSLLHQATYATDPAWTDKVTSIGREAARYRQQAPAPGALQRMPITPENAVAGAPLTLMPITPENAAGGIALTPMSAPATPQQARIQQGLSQFDVGLSTEDALAACGPVATVWFAQNVGGTPTIGQAMDLAKQFGWNRERGAAGPASIVSTLQGLGVNATQMAPDAASVAREIQAGRPVILDTPNHYFQLQDYNPQTGQFQFGDAVGRGRWSRLEDVGQFGQGAARTAIVVRQ